MKIVLALNLCSAAFAFGAAIFWFKSAASKIPAMPIVWDGPGPDDPFMRAMHSAAADNRIAALLSGVSALLLAVALVLAACEPAARAR